MVIVFHSYYEKYNLNNLLFKDAQAEIGDDLLSPFLSIAEKAKNEGVEVRTSYDCNLDKVDAIVFVEQPRQTDLFFRSAINSKIPLFLITLESPIIMPQNYDHRLHSIYEKVFTWHDELINTQNDKYVKVNYSFNFPSTIPYTPKAEKKLLTLISGNKNSKFPNELYSARVDLIKYMETRHVDDFEFYGFGWDYFAFGESIPERILNKLKIPKKFLGRNHQSYKGPVSRKNAVLRKFSFSLCYENVKDIPGYITEKLFDCFFAGCIPIYLGADNIENYIPKNCFIDRRQFSDLDELYTFLKSMSEEAYKSYVNNIQIFVASEMAQAFSNQSFSSTIIHGVLDIISKSRND